LKNELATAINKVNRIIVAESRVVDLDLTNCDIRGWKIERVPGPEKYWHIDTGGGDDTPDGGLKKREQPQEPVVNYVSVDSVADFSKKIAKLGGKICMAKTAVPQMDYFAVCQDTEGNAFGLWESDANAK